MLSMTKSSQHRIESAFDTDICFCLDPATYTVNRINNKDLHNPDRLTNRGQVASSYVFLMFNKMQAILSDQVTEHRFHGTAPCEDSQTYSKRCQQKVGKCHNDDGTVRSKRDTKRLH